MKRVQTIIKNLAYGFVWQVKKIFRAKWLRENAFSVLVFAAVMAIMLYGFNDAAQSSSEESMRMTEDNLRRAVVSCYALEGRYPPNVDYLREQYGLQLNDEKYIVHYEIFAENIMPDITVLER